MPKLEVPYLFDIALHHVNVTDAAQQIIQIKGLEQEINGTLLHTGNDFVRH